MYSVDLMLTVFPPFPCVSQNVTPTTYIATHRTDPPPNQGNTFHVLEPMFVCSSLECILFYFPITHLHAVEAM